ELVGAVPDESGQLLVMTIAGREDFPPGLVTTMPKMGDVYAWHTPIAAAAADSEGPNSAELNIVAIPTGRDMEVCWPAGGTADTAGWKLGGQPARAVASRSDSSC